MNQYMVGILVEDGGISVENNYLTKIVAARSEGEALKKAKNLVQKENPEINYMKIWSWHIEELNESEVQGVLKLT